MTLDDAYVVLGGIAAHDRRTVGHADARVWHDALDDIDLADAIAAVKQYFREEDRWLYPASIRRRALAIRAARLERATIPAPPPGLTDDPAAYRAALLTARRAVAAAPAYRPEVGA